MGSGEAVGPMVSAFREHPVLLTDAALHFALVYDTLLRQEFRMTPLQSRHVKAHSPKDLPLRLPNRPRQLREGTWTLFDVSPTAIRGGIPGSHFFWRRW